METYERIEKTEIHVDGESVLMVDMVAGWTVPSNSRLLFGDGGSCEMVGDNSKDVLLDTLLIERD